MGFSLKGWVTGAADALSDKMDQERKDTNAIIANRTKLAFQNYQKQQEQDMALREEIKKRDAEARQYDPDLTEAQRIAIGADASNVFLTKYKEIVNAGNPNNVKLGDIIEFKKSAPEQTFDLWMKTSMERPLPTASSVPTTPETMFGPSAATQSAEYEKYAKSVGMSAQDLMAYEKPQEAIVLSPVASLNAELIKMPESPEAISKRLFSKLSTTKEGSPEYATLQKEIEQHGDRMRKFDELSGNKNYQYEFNNNRNKAYQIIADPAKFTPEDRKWAKTFVDNDTKRESEAAVIRNNALKDKSIDLTSYISSAIKNDVEMIPQRTINGVTIYGGGTDKFREGSAEANNLIAATKVAAAKRVLVAANMIDKDGSVKMGEKTSLMLSAAGVTLYNFDGKTYLEDKLTVTRQTGGTSGVAKLITEAIAKGVSEEEIKSSNKFTQDELKAAGISMQSAPPGSPLPPEPQVETPPSEQPPAFLKDLKAAAEEKRKRDEQRDLEQKRMQRQGKPFVTPRTGMTLREKIGR